jgi:superkiller protein 3
MYVPLTGLAIMLAWGARDAVARRPARAWLAAFAALAACAAMGVLTRRQTAYWQDTETLFWHTLDLDPGNYQAWDLLAEDLVNNPATASDAIAYYRRALRLNPRAERTRNLLGEELIRLGRYDEAIGEYRALVRMYPAYSGAHYNLGGALSMAGRGDEAIAEFRTALRLEPDSAPILNDLGAALMASGRLAEGRADFERALRSDPEYAPAHYNLGTSLLDEGRLAEAVAQFGEALRILPDYAAAHGGLGVALSRIPGRRDDAIEHLETAQRLRFDPRRQVLLDRLKAERSAELPASR